MKLSPVVGRYFDAWIKLQTWDSGHQLDQQRFYRFVKAIVRYSRRRPSSIEVESLIEARWEGRRDSESLEETARHFASIYTAILDYENTNGFPNPLIERTNIVQCQIWLASENVSEQQLDNSMSHLWGEDWRIQLQRAIAMGLHTTSC